MTGTYAALPTSDGWKNPILRGVMGANCSVGVAQITDGASNTILLGEIRAGITDFDSRGVWAMSGGCPSALWGHGGVIGDDYGPNHPADRCRRRVGVQTRLPRPLGGADGLIEEGMPCYTGDVANWQQTARSMHADGVNTCFADGSVHWISDYIQILPSSPPGICPCGTV